MSEPNSQEVNGQEQQTKSEQSKLVMALKQNQNVVEALAPGSNKEGQTIPQLIVIEKQQNLNNNHAKEQQKPSSNSNHQFALQKAALKSQLQSMQFESHLIEQAIQVCSNLDQAIQFIINRFQQGEKEQLGLTTEVKMFFIVRMDLKMGTGKIAAQVAHATLKAFQNMRYSCSTNDMNASLLIEWMQKGQQSKILQAETENDLHFYLNKAANKFINNCYIRDAGRTQIAAGSMTVAAIGPVRQCDVEFLKGLKDL